MDINTIMPFVIIGIVLAVFACIGLYYLIRFMKGNIRISLPHSNYFLGDKIQGHIAVMAKKDIDANKVLVSLLCEEKQRSHTSKGNSSHWVEIFRADNVVADGTTIRAGSSKMYDFSLTAPPNMGGSASAQTGNTGLNAMFSFMSFFKPPRRWLIEARVDAKGVDLKNRLHISMQEKAGSATITN